MLRNKCTTGKFDCNSQEIFKGDKVLKIWGGTNDNGKIINHYKVHTIVLRDARYMIGKSYNNWNGGELKKLSASEFKKLNMPEDEYFYYTELGVPTLGIPMTEQDKIDNEKLKENYLTLLKKLFLDDAHK